MVLGLLSMFGLFVLSLAVLIKASDWFIESSERIGLGFGVSPFIIGVTIVAFGTSLPELATSIAAVSQGSSEIVIGNVVGSNIANLLLVIGLTIIIGGQIRVSSKIFHVDVPYLFLSSFYLWFTLRDLHFSVMEAIFALVLIGVYLFNSVRENRSITDEVRAGYREYLMLLVGGILIYFGAEYTIYSITRMSEMMGINSEIIALSLVALGTSLPEVFVSVSAMRKGKSEISVGNVIGSNLFNAFGVMGIPSLFGLLKIPAEVESVYIPYLLAITLLFILCMVSRRMGKLEGWIFLLLYAYFVIEMFLPA